MLDSNVVDRYKMFCGKPLHLEIYAVKSLAHIKSKDSNAKMDNRV